MLINSIYLASEGEGIHIGTPQVFVRFNGCEVHCDNCDSYYTWSFRDGNQMTLDEVMNEIYQAGHDGKIKRVSITGGDPLHDRHVEDVITLIKALKEKKYFVNLEASGTKIIHKVFDLLDFISTDYKTPSTGVKTDMNHILELHKQYKGRFQIKSVIETKKDFDYVLAAKNEIEKKGGLGEAYWVLTPCYNTNESFPEERFQNVLDWNQKAGGPFRVIGQQHKWIFGPKKTNV